MADELADGTYVVASAANTSLRIDSTGAYDGNFSVVQLFTANNTDAQFVHVFTRGFGDGRQSDDSRKLMFACTGKCIDINGGHVTAGRIIDQYDDVDYYTTGAQLTYMAQAWDILPAAGQMITYSGTTYQLYRIAAAGNNDLCLVPQNHTVASGQDFYLQDCSGQTEGSLPTYELFFFMPTPSIPDGTYHIRPLSNLNYALDLGGSSHQQGAYVMAYPEHAGTGVDYGNNQVLSTVTNAETGRTKMKFAHSNLLMEIWDMNTAHDFVQLSQCGDYNGTDQQWIVTKNAGGTGALNAHGYAAFNGVSYPTYTIHNYASQGASLVVDIGGLKGQHCYIHDLMPGNYNQIFIFTPTEATAGDLPVPAVTGLSLSNDGAGAAKTLASNESPTTFYPVWTGDGAKWQWRYRYRTRIPGGTIGDWGTWHSGQEGSIGNDGWGLRWYPTDTLEDVRTKVGRAMTLPAVDNSAVEYEEVEVEVRRFIDNWHGTQNLYAHGQPDTETIKIGWKPTLTITGASWSPEGLRVTYSDDYLTGGQTLKFTKILDAPGNDILDGTFSQGNMPHTGIILIPQDRLNGVPAENSSLAISARVDTDVSYDTTTGTVSVTYDSNQGIEINPTYEYTDRYTVKVTLPERHQTDICWIWGENAGLAKCDELTGEADNNRVWEAYPPLDGTKFRIFVLSKNADGTWGSSGDELTPFRPFGGMVWNTVDTNGKPDCAILWLNVDDRRVTRSEDRSRSTTTLTTTGRAYPVVRYTSKSEGLDLGVEGVIYNEGVAKRKWADLKDIQRLGKFGHCIFRDPTGLIANVAVTGVNIPYDDTEYRKASVKQVRETI